MVAELMWVLVEDPDVALGSTVVFATRCSRVVDGLSREQRLEDRTGESPSLSDEERDAYADHVLARIFRSAKRPSPML